ncbi:sterol desaturase family protein [Aspergillus fijiensis CBS 313.89]|uniref:Fatty acid hydroxylase domain-containing protein n=1 Tax=Aspergillus fijiensis CBS 313.89 TaxID=1448319 RepID=A0A8G1RVT9_9EURO|nr:uncharacterized protein BO72DRAFT_504914 [Aspergillus fijiensis CBS 313.89]RAK79662.1 hypothetical protein BO72DRAFT_504914 [Aspergillus fijiensis CBS 313.89]
MSQWILERVNRYLTNLDRNVPIHSKDDKVPYVADIQLHRWILVHAGVPLLIHQLYASTTGNNLSPIAAFVFYFSVFAIFLAREFRLTRTLGQEYGFFDGDGHARDRVRDFGPRKAITSMLLAALLRPLMKICLTYTMDDPPTSTDWAWLLPQVTVYGIVVDFWYYWSHRLAHEVPALWRFHRTHHLTKHPNALLTGYADDAQGLVEIAGLPLVAHGTMKLLGLPMGFYAWYLADCYVTFTEVFGHSGVRLHMSSPSGLTWLMRRFEADLVVEDHDLHHRSGWRRSSNYGKHTRIWDRVFGTCRARVEGTVDNIDYQNRAEIPVL